MYVSLFINSDSEHRLRKRNIEREDKERKERQTKKKQERRKRKKEKKDKQRERIGRRLPERGKGNVRTLL